MATKVSNEDFVVQWAIAARDGETIKDVADRIGLSPSNVIYRFNQLSKFSA